LDDIRSTRDGAWPPPPYPAEQEARAKYATEPLTVRTLADNLHVQAADTRLFDAANALVADYRLHVERVQELDKRLSRALLALRSTRSERDQAIAERDGARERAVFFNIAPPTEKQRADRLQRDVDNHVCKVLSGHVCTERCKPNSHVAHEGRHRLNEAEARVADLESERHGLISGRRADHEEIVALRESRDEWRSQAERALAEVSRRYTAAQVGDAQASEAELVAAPLRERVRELEKWLDRRQECQNRAENEASRLRVANKALDEFYRKVADTVAAEAVSQAIDPENPDYETEPSRATLRNVARQVRQEVRRTKRTVVNLPDSHISDFTHRGCGIGEGSPASPTE